VHESLQFLSTPTLSAALYLMVLHFFGKQYARLPELLPSCMPDSATETSGAAPRLPAATPADS
jgi:hypothetical protein